MPKISLAPVAGAVSLVLFVQPVLAEESSAPDESPQTLVVSATRLATPAVQLGSSVTVIMAADIAAQQLRTVSDVLKRVPGLNIVQSGGRAA
ncbi:MAG: TonB-dependent receptor plug domain-containing protein [Steroidobacteraceae bacterium]